MIEDAGKLQVVVFGCSGHRAWCDGEQKDFPAPNRRWIDFGNNFPTPEIPLSAAPPADAPNPVSRGAPPRPAAR